MGKNVVEQNEFHLLCTIYLTNKKGNISFEFFKNILLKLKNLFKKCKIDIECRYPLYGITNQMELFYY